MAIDLSTLTEASTRFRVHVTKAMVEEARTRNAKTVFLCHSHKDEQYVKGFVQLLNDAGWDAYVDWMDHDMPPRPNRKTAENIQRRIKQSTYFMFLATPNAMKSRWCPWEIGYADGVKQSDRIFVAATRDGGGIHGNEYLDLYRRVNFSEGRRLKAWQPGDTEHGVEIASL
ncbi:hypothetical protein GCM10009115_15480 [Sphingopyxis soli]|jgi:hypothetical protein|uniref:TIR domain-containing protein n=1 Tax=Sphingopyxis soli TaxID=592051 RepID=A0ABN1M3S5_9SPHN|nr:MULTISPECIES: toll/interleukin-1 receptor domain-containing protein [Sphingopyxis]MBJ7498233.1 toll/interleukin-1 receptor domain-containing protein [Sphingopyxis sp.]HMO73932.1 toll/interleukin-1 receptor domain-containing protein [Sphingopyxis sp.]HMP43465.1 toll/interleukin-1 receptor domain-containing protein [Sphingopyxis sp.]HMQ19342.1 toll/interleukin-1 receptor domain-containing protein [Sphingopyxis sp.]